MIYDRIQRIREQITDVCQKLGTNPKDITLVGVTKYANAQAVKEAIDCGLSDIGENKVQDAQEKFAALADLSAGKTFKKHLLGHLQTNKAKAAVKLFDLIQSVDTLKVAQEIDKESQKQGRAIEILIEVNVSKEEQKYGVLADDALPLISEISQLKNLKVAGLMAMAPHAAEEKVIRDCFRGLKRLFDQSKKDFSSSSSVQMKYLSMGMTDDFPIAIEEGSNMVRVGRAIFAQ